MSRTSKVRARGERDRLPTQGQSHVTFVGLLASHGPVTLNPKPYFKP